MNKRIYLLLIILVLQGAFIAFQYQGSGRLPSHAGTHALLDFNREKVTGIRISNPEGAVELKRIEDGAIWQTADGFPVDANRLEQLLNNLKEVQYGLPVAQTAAAFKRFRVVEESFERRVQLMEGDSLVADFFLGSGAGARRSHVRKTDGEAVYAISLASYDFPLEMDDWQDKTTLQIAEESVEAVRMKGLTARRETVEEQSTPEEEESPPESRWIAESLAEAERFNDSEFESVLKQLANLRFEAARPLAKFEPEAKTVNEFTVEYDEQERTYRLFPAANPEADGYRLRVSGEDFYYELSNYLGSALAEKLTAENLIEKPEPEPEPSSESEADTDSASKRSSDVNQE